MEKHGRRDKTGSASPESSNAKDFEYINTLYNYKNMLAYAPIPPGSSQTLHDKSLRRI